MQSDISQKISEEKFQKTDDTQVQGSEELVQSPETVSEPGNERKPKKEKEKVTRKSVIRNILWFLCGILWGITLAFIGGILYLRHNLIQEIPIEGDFAQNADKIGPAAYKFGWQVSYNDCGLPRLIDNQPIEVYRFCKTPYAYELLKNEDERKISCMLPCAISIYKKSDGITYISKLNMPLITQLLGGNSIGIFNEKILPEQREILSQFPERQIEKKQN